MPQLPIADDMYLAAHDTVGGKPVLTPATLGIGLSAGLLAELLFWRRIILHNDTLRVVDQRPTPDDPAATSVLDQLLRDSHYQQVRDWIAFLSTGVACELVERRLSRSGLVVRQEKRKLLGRVSFYVPRDSIVAGSPGSRIRTAIERREVLDQQALVLAGLMLATGLDQHTLGTLDSREREYLFEQLRTNLHPMLRELVQHAESAVGSAVMTGRA